MVMDRLALMRWVASRLDVWMSRKWRASTRVLRNGSRGVVLEWLVEARTDRGLEASGLSWGSQRWHINAVAHASGAEWTGFVVLRGSSGGRATACRRLPFRGRPRDAAHCVARLGLRASHRAEARPSGHLARASVAGRTRHGTVPRWATTNRLVGRPLQTHRAFVCLNRKESPTAGIRFVTTTLCGAVWIRWARVPPRMKRVVTCKGVNTAARTPTVYDWGPPPESQR